MMGYFEKITIEEKRDIIQELKVILKKVEGGRDYNYSYNSKNSKNSNSNSMGITTHPADFDILFYTL